MDTEGRIRQIFCQYNVGKYSMHNPTWAPSKSSSWMCYANDMITGSVMKMGIARYIDQICPYTYNNNSLVTRDNNLKHADIVNSRKPTALGIYARKIFIGGLPRHDSNSVIPAVVLTQALAKFGPVVIDWPHRDENQFAPRDGFAFAIYDTEQSVHDLLKASRPSANGDMLGIKNNGVEQAVQIRPWRCKNKYWNNDQANMANFAGYEQFSVFIGGVPRVITAEQLGRTLTKKLGDVVKVEIETDKGTNYPKGAARAVFASREAYVIALARRHITLEVLNVNKEIEIKPYLAEHFLCNICGSNSGKNFCGELSCLKYMCDYCWNVCHHVSTAKNEHRPMTRGCYYRELETVKLTKVEDHSHISEAQLSSSGCSSTGHRERTNTTSEPLHDHQDY